MGEQAAAFVASRHGLAADAVHYRTGYSTDLVSHVYLHQAHDGIPFTNAVANVAFHADGKVASFGSSFVKTSTFLLCSTLGAAADILGVASIASSTPAISVDTAVKAAEAALDATYNAHPTELKYVVKEDHSAVLVHSLQVQNEATGAWYEAHVDAHSGALVSAVDFVAKATVSRPNAFCRPAYADIIRLQYRVLPISEEVLTQGLQTLTNPEDTVSSPYGWLSTNGQTQSTTTQGNNAYAYIGSTPASQSSSGAFVFTQSPSSAPTSSANKNAAITNAFYVVNSIHDITVSALPPLARALPLTFPVVPLRVHGEGVQVGSDSLVTIPRDTDTYRSASSRRTLPLAERQATA
jgi:extracellular elastinolytic metalloproteinase